MNDIEAGTGNPQDDGITPWSGDIIICLIIRNFVHYGDAPAGSPPKMSAVGKTTDKRAKHAPKLSVQIYSRVTDLGAGPVYASMRYKQELGQILYIYDSCFVCGNSGWLL